MGTIQRNMNKAFVLLYFYIVPAAFSNYVILIYAVLSLIPFFSLVFSKRRDIRIKGAGLIIVDFLMAVSVIGIFVSPYSMINTIQCVLFLLIAFVSYSDMYYDAQPSHRVGELRARLFEIDWFYWVGIISILAHLALQIGDYGLFYDRFYIPCGAWDVNVCLFSLFAFYCYGDAKRYRLWIPVAILTTLFSRGSRMALLLLALFVVIKIGKWIVAKAGIRHCSAGSSTKKTLLVFVAATVVTLLFSFVWVNGVSATGVGTYHSGINDDSNASRFRSNVYVVEHVFGTTDFIFYGYGDDIREVIGDFDNTSNFQTFLGYRLIQSHNSILNMFMKNGIIFALLYLILLSRLLSSYFSYERAEYWIPYLIGSMLVHGMFITGFFMAFLVGIDADKGPMPTLEEQDKRKSSDAHRLGHFSLVREECRCE